MNKPINLGWGYPICVKEVLDFKYISNSNLSPTIDMDYPAYEGKEALINQIKNLTGKKYVIITNGATQAINIILRALRKHENKEIVMTNKHTFPYYSGMIHKAGLTQQYITKDTLSIANNVINLIDMPSNPWGKVHEIKDLSNNTIHDAVYNNKIYINSTINRTVNARIEVGSVSKLLGITGARIGWIATNDWLDYSICLEECKLENCGVSVPSQDIIIDIFDRLDLEDFMTIAQGRINFNREEFLKLNAFLDEQVVSTDGMFYCAWVDNKGLDIIDKANVSYIVLEVESNKKLIRFNLAQNNTLTKQAIKAILIADRIIK